MSVEELNTQLNDENLIILDASIPPVGAMEQPTQCWPRNIIPGARRFDIDKEFCLPEAKYPHTMPTTNRFEEQARLLGINLECKIVVYDWYGIFSSARAWWMFKSMGHKQVYVLNGGLPAWLNAGYRTEEYRASELKAGNFVASFDSSFFHDSQSVLSKLEDENYCVLDARASARFYGHVAEPRAGVRSGHMPGALNLPFIELLEKGQMKSEPELISIIEKLTLTDKSLIFSCGSGVTACVLALAFDICGYPHLSVYDGSWSEWGARSELPVVKD